MPVAYKVTVATLVGHATRQGMQAPWRRGRRCWGRDSHFLHAIYRGPSGRWAGASLGNALHKTLEQGVVVRSRMDGVSMPPSGLNGRDRKRLSLLACSCSERADKLPPRPARGLSPARNQPPPPAEPALHSRHTRHAHRQLALQCLVAAKRGGRTASSSWFLISCRGLTRAPP